MATRDEQIMTCRELLKCPSQKMHTKKIVKHHEYESHWRICGRLKKDETKTYQGQIDLDVFSESFL